MRVVFYGRRKRPAYEFICKVAIEDRAKILACLRSVEELGFNCPRVEFRQIQGRLWEIKIQSISGGFRIFYTMIKNNTLVLLHAYHKKTQKAPKREIKLAEKRMFEVMKDESIYIG